MDAKSTNTITSSFYSNITPTPSSCSDLINSTASQPSQYVCNTAIAQQFTNITHPPTSNTVNVDDAPEIPHTVNVDETTEMSRTVNVDDPPASPPDTPPCHSLQGKDKFTIVTANKDSVNFG
jgi:hypothetical protein